MILWIVFIIMPNGDIGNLGVASDRSSDCSIMIKHAKAAEPNGESYICKRIYATEEHDRPNVAR